MEDRDVRRIMGITQEAISMMPTTALQNERDSTIGSFLHYRHQCLCTSNGWC